jgi:hypothetical protein
MEDETYANWPDCVIDGCPNKCCLALDSIFCFPHTAGNEHVKRMKIGAANITSLDLIEAAEDADCS